MIKLIISFFCAAASVILYKKTRTLKEEPQSANLIFLVCLFPVLNQFIISRGDVLFSPDFITVSEKTLTTVFFIISVQHLVIGAGVNFFKSDSDYKITVWELIPLLTCFTAVNLIYGFGLNLLLAFALGFLSTGLYLKTKSLDLSLAINLLFGSVDLYCDLFVKTPKLEQDFYELLYIGNCLMIIILGIWIIQDFFLTFTEKDGKFNV